MNKALLGLAGVLLFGAGVSAGVTSPQGLHKGDIMPHKASVPTNSTRADNDVSFAYFSEIAQFYGDDQLEKGDYVHMAIKIPDDVVNGYAGTQISSISVFGGFNEKMQTNPDTEITVFITNGLSRQPVYTQDERISNVPGKENVVLLNTPYTIEAGKELYIGYKFKARAVTVFTYFMPTDDISTTESSNFFGISKEEGEMPGEDAWENRAEECGSLALVVTFDGKNIPANSCRPSAIPTLKYMGLNQTPTYLVNLLNTGSMPISSIKPHVEAEGEAAYDVPLTLANQLGVTGTATVELPGKAFTTVGDKNVKITITEVNGRENTLKGIAATYSLTCLETAFTRMPVVEVATGSWCGYCPCSLVTLERINDEWKDRAVGIAYHFATSERREPMSNRYSLNWVREFDTSNNAPFGLTNRYMYYEHATSTYKDMDESLMRQINIGSLLQPTISGFTTDGNSGKVTGNVKFALDVTNKYGVEIVITQDGIGPYNQENYYNGQKDNPMHGWENAGATVSTVYNNVCIYASDIEGKTLVEGDENQKLEAMKEYPFEFDVDLSSQFLANSNDEPFDKTRLRAIALVIDKSNGMILNSTYLDKEESGVEGIASDETPVRVTTGKGSISVTGAKNVAIYNMAGMIVAGGNAEGLAPGIYIVKADNKAEKVLVK